MKHNLCEWSDRLNDNYTVGLKLSIIADENVNEIANVVSIKQYMTLSVVFTVYSITSEE